LILDKGHAFYSGTSEVVNAIVKSGTLLTVDAHVHHTNNYASELVESSVASQIFRYPFVAPLIEDEIDYETVDSSVVTSSEPSEFPRVDYFFMIVSIDSFSNESSEFLTMI